MKTSYFLAIVLTTTVLSSTFLNAAPPSNLAGVDGQVRAYGVDTSGNNIDSTSEAAAILAAVQTQLAGGVGGGTTGNITAGAFGAHTVNANASALNSRTDWGGSAGSRSPTLPYTGHTGSTDDFIQGAKFSMFVPAGTYTVFANSDDGFSIKFSGVNFFNRIGGGVGNQLSNDEIRFEGPTGGSNTGASFTLAADSIIDVDGFFFERAGGDFFEIGIAPGIVTTADFTGPYQIISGDAAFSNSLGIYLGSNGLALVPEPASIALWSVLGVGLIGGGYWQRRRSKARR